MVCLSHAADLPAKKQDYTFHKTLGKGTFGVVRAATRNEPDGGQRKVAVKVVSKHLLKGHEEVVMREIETVQGLNHPHIVKLIDWFESKDKVCPPQAYPVLSCF